MKALQGLTAEFMIEHQRWTEDKEKYQSRLECLIGDCLLAFTFFCYLGPLNYEYRQKLLVETVKSDLVYRNIPITSNLHVR
jgi:hypothetical protein